MNKLSDFGSAALKPEGGYTVSSENAQKRLDMAAKEIEEVLHKYYLELGTFSGSTKLQCKHTDKTMDIDHG